MKFSYKLLKKLVPEISSKVDLVEKITAHLFEVESVAGDVFDIKILPNRYSDAACYWGLAKELSAIYGGKFKFPISNFQFPINIKRDFKLSIKTKLCRRMMTRYFENIKIGPSPKWLVKALEASGARSINNMVDITNYVTLETGQPLHAFDFDKMAGGQLIVRQAQKSEVVETLDEQRFELDSSVAVLADKKDPLDIAGIKGGKKAEITSQTKNILLTAGNFDGTSIYQTSKKINLVTDASTRFSHNISPELVDWGMTRASELIKSLCGGQASSLIDVYPSKPKKKLLKFGIEKFNSLTGLQLKENQALNYLKKLGFGIKSNLVEAPLIRTDIERFEDLAEEIIRLYGYQNLKGIPPHVTLQPSGFEDQIVLQDKIRKILISLGLNEIYNYSFSDKGDIKLENPVSKELSFLRHHLADGLIKNIEGNFRYFNEVSLFEIGHVFSYPDRESVMLGLVLGDKREKTFFELKGMVDQILERVGLVEWFMREETSNRLRIESDHHVLGYLMYTRESEGKNSVAEIDLEKLLKLVTEEKEYEPLPKYPSIIRDLTILAPREVRVNEIMYIIENTAPKYLDDVDLIDTYEDPEFKGQESLTFRLVFLAEDRTLTDEEVSVEMEKIIKVLVDKLVVEIR